MDAVRNTPRQSAPDDDRDLENAEAGADAAFEWEFGDSPASGDFRSGQRREPGQGPKVQAAGPEESPVAADDERAAIDLGDRAGEDAIPPYVPREAGLYAGAHGRRRANYVRYQLDEALARWWASAELPSEPLLRDGLLLGVAGQPLDEEHRSLLLRGALYHGHGLVSVMGLQTDPERTAILLLEAVVAWNPPIAPQAIVWLQRTDPASSQWAPILLRLAKQETAAGREPAAVRAADLTDLLTAPDSAQEIAVQVEPTPDGFAPARRWLYVAGLFALAASVLGLAWWWAQPYVRDDSVPVPAGTYLVRDPAARDAERTVTLGAYRIDRYEVTNGAYLRCVEQGRCPAPASLDSETRASYFGEGAYRQHPVVHISWHAAKVYCQWRGARLPTAEEWEVAAGYAPGTQRQQLYPWGERFAEGFANGAGTYRDTRAIGSYRTAGDSPSGAVDMAGNVAEWTATAVTGEQAGRVVKGGSYATGPVGLATNAQEVLPEGYSAAWIGFRCARPLR
jgi:iron(II)-dependent oxidoreductase